MFESLHSWDFYWKLERQPVDDWGESWGDSCFSFLMFIVFIDVCIVNLKLMLQWKHSDVADNYLPTFSASVKVRIESTGQPDAENIVAW